jgi:NAD(P)-dependent dehydrogenase (short-subunit alcohol dehydrogenase family)
VPDLNGRTALVTGGSRGIGAGIALALARSGADVAVNYANNSSAADVVVEEIRALGRKAQAFQADNGLQTDCEILADQVLAEFGKVDILVNNGGIGQSTIGRPLLADTTPEQLHTLLNQHALGAFHLSRLLLPQMRAQTRSDIVMISSVATRMYGARQGAYSMAKAAMEALAFVLAKEEREYGVRVNVVAPGIVETDMGATFVRQLFGVTDIHEIESQAPFGFLCQPEDIANAVVFLCSDEGRYITGNVLRVDGGRT